MTTLDVDLISAIFLSTRSDGKFEDEHLETLQRLGKKRKMVLLAFAPKAAGTYFRSAVIHAIDGKIVRVTQASGGRDATPYLPTFVMYYNGGVTDNTLVAHVHMLALPANIHFLEAFDIRPIIMTRCIPDMLASYWDMLDSDAEARKEGLNCHIPDNFPQLSKTAKADFMVDILGPWYANYFNGWLSYAESDPERVCVLDYDSLRSDPAATLKKALDHAGLPHTPEECAEAINETWLFRKAFRFNKGEGGRGASYFSPEHIERLARLLGHYPDLAPYSAELLGVAPR